MSKHLAALVLLALGWSLMPGALAQYSPNCLRNGKKDFCAITPVPGATTEQQTVELLTFADHAVYELLRNEGSCRKAAEHLRTCDARIITPPGSPQAIPAFYRGTDYEGGYRHEYVGKGIHLIYFFLD